VFQQSPVKRIYSKPINGNIFVSLLENYVSVFNSDKHINLTKAWHIALDNYSDQVLTSASTYIKDQIGNTKTHPVALEDQSNLYGLIRLSI